MSLPISCHNAQFGTLGQIDASHLAEIAAQGYKSVINNRPDGEGGPGQPSNASIQAEAEKLGRCRSKGSGKRAASQRKARQGAAGQSGAPQGTGPCPDAGARCFWGRRLSGA